MPSDRLVTPQHALKAVMEFERRGSKVLMLEWERLEPDLIEYVLESMTVFYHGLLDVGLSGVQARRLYRRAEKILLVSLISLRQAQRDNWAGGHETTAADPPDPPPEPASP